MMDPQVFVRLSIGSLALRIPVTPASNAGRGANLQSSTSCMCEIRLHGFPVQTASVPLISSAESIHDSRMNAAVFYLEKSHLKALMAHGCFRAVQSYLEIVVYFERQGPHCGFSGGKQLIGRFRVEVGSECGEGSPALLHNGWISIGKDSKEGSKIGPEMHLRVKLDPDPRYVFEFEDETALSPQIVQLHGNSKQPIFSCKFSQDRRATHNDAMASYWANPSSTEQGGERRERKGWKVMIHDLCGSAVAAAFISTPFVPSAGSDRVVHSNPGAWLILFRPDRICSFDGWQPWGRLEAWREIEPRDAVYLRLILLPDGQDAGVVVAETRLSPRKGGEFFIDMDRLVPEATLAVDSGGGGGGGFVMNCRVEGEGKSGRPAVQLATRHVSCVEDAAVFVALAAAVDLSVQASRPFGRKGIRNWGRLSQL